VFRQGRRKVRGVTLSGRFDPSGDATANSGMALAATLEVIEVPDTLVSRCQ
jgi:hypothetical protein